MEYSSASKKKEILSYATWMNLEDFMRSVIKPNTVWLHLYEVSKLVKLIEATSKMVAGKDR